YPVHTSLPTISGTAGDYGLGKIFKVEIRLKKVGAGYWNGTNWAGSPDNWFITSWNESLNQWTFATAGINFDPFENYEIETKAVDKADNSQTVYSLKSFRYEPPRPQSVITSLQDGKYFSAVTIINGTCSDGSGDTGVTAKIEIAIKRKSDNYDWTGSSWTEGTASSVFWSTGTVALPNWSYDRVPDWGIAGSSYTVRSRATSDLGVVEVPGTPPNIVVTWTFDNQEPNSKVTLPNKAFFNSLPTISGTAADAHAGIERVDIQLRRGTSYYWDGTSQSWTLDVTWSTTTWVGPPDNYWFITIPSSAWSSGQTYSVKSRATDKAITGNVEGGGVGGSWFDFIYDITPPNTLIRLPEYNYHNSMTTISGTASDPSPGHVENTEIRVWSYQHTRYWNNSVKDWTYEESQAEQAWFLTQSTATDATIWFSTAIPESKWVNGGWHRIEARAKDVAGNYDLSYSTKEFMFDNSAPVMVVQFPPYNILTFRNTLPVISGTSYDLPTSPANSGLGLRYVAIRQNVDNKWWSPTGNFDNDIPYPFSVTDLGSGGWQYTGLSTSKLISGASYYITTKVHDVAGNVTDWCIYGSTFVWDVTSPTSTVTYPQDGGSYRTATLTTISGTQSDVYPFEAALVAGVPAITGAVKVSIQDLTYPSTYWVEGTGWVAGAEQWNNAIVYQSSWVYSVSNVGFVSGRYYKIRSRAIDASLPNGNDQETQFPSGGCVILFDTHPPVCAVTYPVESVVNNITLITG
ncbi:MAG: hypothetical protein NDF58_09000, partial [archaeon YNP-LCB-024-027]|nr:hypothetical protein [Candidatus Culexarchaeum yellowstonense]